MGQTQAHSNPRAPPGDLIETNGPKEANSVPSHSTHVQTNEPLGLDASVPDAPGSIVGYLNDVEEHMDCDNDDDEDDDYDYDSFDSDEDEEDEEDYDHWSLQLPIQGSIARRRAFDRGQDPIDIRRQQRSQLFHEMEVRNGPLRNVNTCFHPVDFGTGMQHRARLAKILGGEAISPRAVPRVEQMNLAEYEQVFGDVARFIGWEKDRNCVEGVQEPFDLLDYCYVPTLSAPSDEGVFVVNPYQSRPRTATTVREGVKPDW